MWMDSITTVVDFIAKNRSDFEVVSSGYRNIAVFKKISEDQRPWDEFFPFCASGS